MSLLLFFIFSDIDLFFVFCLIQWETLYSKLIEINPPYTSKFYPKEASVAVHNLLSLISHQFYPKKKKIEPQTYGSYPHIFKGTLITKLPKHGWYFKGFKNIIENDYKSELTMFWQDLTKVTKEREK